MKRKLWPVWLVVVLSVPGGRADESVPTKLHAKHLPNAFQLHTKVISGGLPEGDEAFQELQALGVKTVISVDGAKPNLTLAKKYGLRYVHLPHGYDGISAARAQQLAKAVRDLPGQIYLHCHHGKHRSPAAAAVACVGAGLLPVERARSVLEAAGTSENYRGLFQAAETAKRFDDRSLDELKVEFAESVRLPAMAEAMVAIEHAHDHLQTMAKNGWKPMRQHPDLTAAHEALLLREHFTELLRSDELRGRSASFRSLIRTGEETARELESALNEARDRDADAALVRISKNCLSCHREFRDPPLTSAR